MDLKIVYSKLSLYDLKGIYDYIRRDSLRYSQREIKLIRAAIQQLKKHPLMGRKFENANDELTRELIFKNYRIVYDIIPDKQINILTIHHHSRLIANNPAFKPENE